MKEIINNINWLVHESGESQRKISRDSGVSPSMINRIRLGHQQIEDLTFKNVIKLNELAERRRG